jgi:hypothetical protein
LQEHLNMFIPRYKKKNVANEIVWINALVCF